MKKLLVIALCIIAVASPIGACGPEYDPAILFTEGRPDDPIDRYVDGHLGIVLPSYYRSHLVVAWRYLSGKPLTKIERDGMLGLIQHRLKQDPGGPNAANEWLKVRAGILHVPYVADQLHVVREGAQYFWITNCTDGAFVTATRTLQARAKELGPDSEAVKSWLTAQDVVFGNCQSGSNVPAPAAASLPMVIRYDRAYQIAAAKFYAMDYDGARELFLAVARDVNSPWHRAARLVAVRALLRKETLVNPSGLLPQAAKELEAMLADPDMVAWQGAANELMHFVTYRIDQKRRMAECVATLRGGSSPAREVYLALDDYTNLFNYQVTSDDDMTDWIQTFMGAGDFSHAMERWRSTKEPQWLVAALAHAEGKQPELLEASKEIGPDSPAYPTVAYHRVRLLIAQGNRDRAKKELDRVLKLGEKGLSRSGYNLLAIERRAFTTNVREYMRDAVLRSVNTGPEDTTGVLVVDEEAAETINHQMPLAMMIEAAHDPKVGEPVRKQLVLAAFVRAAILGREKSANKLAAEAGAYDEEIRGPLAKWVKTSGEERRFATIDLLVHFPGLAPYVRSDPGFRTSLAGLDPFHNNWWCADAASDVEPAPVPPFLGANDDERGKVAAAGCGSTYLLRGVVAWSDARRDDPRVPEAMALAIAGARRTCPDSEMRNAARRAFDVLHKRYPKSNWAKETKYWYAGN